MKSTLCVWIHVLAWAAVLGCGLGAEAETPFLTGVDSNVYLDITENHGGVYRRHGRVVDDYFGMLKEIGVNAARVRVFATTDPNGESHVSYATRTAHMAADNDMHIVLAIFLSDNWADIGGQPASSRWAGQSVGDMADSVQDYCRGLAQHFLDEGIPIAVYAVGNEIDFGISGFFPPDWWSHLASGDTAYAQQYWDEEAQIVAAGQAGIKEVVPDAKFLHHLAFLWNFDFMRDHFQFMIDHGVQINYLGLSLYTSALYTSPLGEIPTNSLSYFKTNAAALHEHFDRPIIIPEWAYPAEPVTDGMFSPHFNHPIPGYPATEDGQAQYVADLITWCKESDFIAGACYFSPELATIPFDIWRFMALFDHDLDARPGLDALSGTVAAPLPASRAPTVAACAAVVLLVGVSVFRGTLRKVSFRPESRSGP